MGRYGGDDRALGRRIGFWVAIALAPVLAVALVLAVDVWLHPRACPHGIAVSHTIPTFGCAP